MKTVREFYDERLQQNQGVLVRSPGEKPPPPSAELQELCWELAKEDARFQVEIEEQ